MLELPYSQGVSYILAWDQEYRIRGPLWGGASRDLPELPEGSRVLELGCGSGKTLSALRGRPWRISALDASLEAVRLCRSITEQEADLLAADACRLPFKGESFHAVLALHVLGHVYRGEREAMASEAARVLRKGGRLIFRGFGMEDMRAGKGELVEDETFRRGRGIITHYFTEEEVAGLFSMLSPEAFRTRRWRMRVRGELLLRSEVEAVFSKV
jgi:ubiquinone/menaquinone biosynthesis C-methylase UbiE